MEEDDQKLRVRLVGLDGRRRYDAVSKDRLVAACLEPGASVSRLALEHGVNANLLWKWIRKYQRAKEETTPIAPPGSAFIPVHIESGTDRAGLKPGSSVALDFSGTCRDVRQPEPEGAGVPSSLAKLNVSLPNGMKLTVECTDLRAVTAIIGALCDVQAGR